MFISPDYDGSDTFVNQELTGEVRREWQAAAEWEVQRRGLVAERAEQEMMEAIFGEESPANLSEAVRQLSEQLLVLATEMALIKLALADDIQRGLERVAHEATRNDQRLPGDSK